jgi:dihydroxyacetone kinase-like protein
MIKKAINDPEKIVGEVIEGLLLASHGRLIQVPGVNAIMRANLEDGKVGLLIGGGSGHEPIYTTYVGPGYADAAACGNIFAAPSPEIIFEATKAIHRGRGVLYVYGNYEGDIMNFEVAAEMAHDEGIEVMHARTMDDIALPKGEGRRGIAGSFFQVKIAGAACRSGLSLEEAYRLTLRAQQNIRSLSVALRPGSLPETGQPTFTLGEDEIEI